MLARRNNDDRRPRKGAAGNEIKDSILNSSSNDDESSSSGDSDSKGNAKPVSINDGGESATTRSSYRDYSNVPPERKNASSILNQASITKEQTFPVKLHMILSNPAFEDIIGWLPHGRSWRILQQKAFEERVISLYFRHGRYSSFARQVNGWGFRRITNGSDYNSYYHELFLRGLPHLCDRMRRLTARDVEKRKKEGDEPTPDFYALNRDHALPESAPVRSTSISLPSATATGTASRGRPVPSLVDVELAILVKRHAEIMDRINLLSSAQESRPDSFVLNHTSILGQQAPGSLGPRELASLQQRFTSSVQSGSAPAEISVAPSINQLFQLQQQQQQQEQQPNIASFLAAWGGNGSGVAPVPAPARAPAPLRPTHAPSTSSDIGAILQQAGLNALLQQGGVGGQPDLGNLLAQLLQSAGGGGNTQPASAPKPIPFAPAPIASSFAQPFVDFGGNQMSAPAPLAMGSSAPANIAQLLGQNSNDPNADLHRQLLEARLANTGLSAFLVMNKSGLGGGQN